MSSLYDVGTDDGEDVGALEHTVIGVRRAVAAVDAYVKATDKDVQASPLTAPQKKAWAQVRTAWGAFFPRTTQGWSGFKAQFLDKTYDTAQKYAAAVAKTRTAILAAGGALTPVSGYADAGAPSKSGTKAVEDKNGSNWKLPSLPDFAVGLPWGKILAGLGVAVGGYFAWSWYSGRRATRALAAPTELVNNPPVWARDADLWERAKLAVGGNEESYDNPDAVITHIYKQMGGRVSYKHAPMQLRGDTEWSTVASDKRGHFEQEREFHIEDGWKNKDFKLNTWATSVDGVRGVNWEVSVDGGVMKHGHAPSFTKAREAAEKYAIGQAPKGGE